MKYIKNLVFLFIALFLLMPSTKAEEKVNIYLFYSDLCSTCASEEEWLNGYLKEKPDVNLVMFEVTRNSDNYNLLKDVRNALNSSELTTPYTVIGTMGITGFSETVEKQIDAAISKYKNKDYIDIVNVIQNNLDIDYEIDYPDSAFDLPILGEVNPKNVSLPLISVVIGFIDGFNPCAMWVLLFLISMLFNMKNRRRMWIIGITFLVASAVVYLAFMLAWLKIAVNLSQIGFVRLIIALIALIGGALNLTSFYKELKDDNGCEVVDDKKRKSIFNKIKKIITHVDDDSKSFWKNEWGFVLALVGIVGLAISVNLVELVCSSGLPLIFTQILAINNLSGLEYWSYILIYIFFFMIDDIIIFIIAMKSLKLTGISTKYNKMSHLIGGIIMLLIGILMILKPEWLMFNF